MSIHRVQVAVLGVALLAGCAGAEEAGTADPVDIAKIGQVKSTFGPEFEVTEKSSGLTRRCWRTRNLRKG